MREDDAVSLWIGVAPSETALRAAVEVSYSEDGDFSGCDFSRAFGIRRFDEDFIEAEYREGSTTTELGALLEGVSYDQIIIERFRAIGEVDQPANCFILLYKFRYTGSVKSASFGGLSMRFWGAVSYE